MATDALTLFMDHKEIEDKVGLWCRIVDTHAMNRMGEVFADDIFWDYGKGTTEQGLKNITHRIEAHLVDTPNCSATQHRLANMRIDVNGDEAESEAYFVGVHAGAGEYEGKTLLQWGNYNDFWKRTPDGWRISRRIYRIDISDGPMGIVYGGATADMWQAGDDRRVGR
ncbi:MAG: nuclear transport factor 2 family protein [Sphingobium phenoxybenzoativorans]|uniref:Nuclear transport factor 2 family protein n=1 Tax=Sphingobium phenoxybenzoativorans TaxID=1592790 RepID=A0A975K9Y8_9SPHN|nr:nuclear transport factor 2 family protein [Sphingobium phenoxybenzoativorans]QUT06753.1 nuclear transport factor 2 family protein [Sphingobium phenoxybenzoativorans]